MSSSIARMGNHPGFVVGWSDWLSTCGTLGVIALVVGEYSAVLIPSLAGRDKAIAVVVVLLFAGLQWRGIRWGSFTQNLTSALKALIFVAIAIAAFTITEKRIREYQQRPLRDLRSLPRLLLRYRASFTPTTVGTSVIYFGEEVRNPKRDVVRSMFGGVLLVVAIYLVVNLAYIHVLPMSQLANESLPAGAIARVLFGNYGDKVIRILAILSLLSTVNAYT
jgi:APA family basic amino acid/polyamine antiporter